MTAMGFVPFSTVFSQLRSSASISGSSAIRFPLSQTLEDAAHIVCPAGSTGIKFLQYL
jgi:hypothetical protein